MLVVDANLSLVFSFFFFFNDTATTEIYTLSLHDALPIWPSCSSRPYFRILRKSVVRSIPRARSEEHTSELQSRPHLVCRLLLEKKLHRATKRGAVDSRPRKKHARYARRIR